MRQCQELPGLLCCAAAAFLLGLHTPARLLIRRAAPADSPAETASRYQSCRTLRSARNGTTVECCRSSTTSVLERGRHVATRSTERAVCRLGSPQQEYKCRPECLSMSIISSIINHLLTSSAASQEAFERSSLLLPPPLIGKRSTCRQDHLISLSTFCLLIHNTPTYHHNALLHCLRRKPLRFQPPGGRSRCHHPRSG